jgi:tetratricopeptide (TPR) repeat protein
MNRKVILTIAGFASILGIPAALFLIKYKQDHHVYSKEVQDLLVPLAQPKMLYHYAEKVPYYEKAIQIEPTDSLKANLAVALVGAGEFEKAKLIFKELETSSSEYARKTALSFGKPGVSEQFYKDGQKLAKEMEEELKKQDAPH